MSALAFLRKTYAARLFEVATDAGAFEVAGTLDGYIDFAVPDGKTYLLTMDEARSLVAALNGSAHDVADNCLYERDALLAKGE